MTETKRKEKRKRQKAKVKGEGFDKLSLTGCFDQTRGINWLNMTETRGKKNNKEERTENKKKSSSRMRLATSGEEPSDNQNKFN